MDKSCKKMHHITFLLLMTSLCACTTTGKVPAPSLGAIAGTNADTVVLRDEPIADYVADVMASNAEAQKKQLVALNQRLTVPSKTDKKNVRTRMRLAALYGLPNSRVRDAGKAQVLLDELLRDVELNNENRIFAGLLRDYLMDTAKLSQRIRDEQRRADTMQAKSDIAQQKTDMLQHKLDELRSIEKTMINRGQGNQ